VQIIETLKEPEAGLATVGRDRIRVTVRAHPFIQGRKADPQIYRNLAPRKPAGQRYPHRIFTKFIRPACADRSCPLLHNM
jgi:hypothetical protein